MVSVPCIGDYVPVILGVGNLIFYVLNLQQLALSWAHSMYSENTQTH